MTYHNFLKLKGLNYGDIDTEIRLAMFYYYAHNGAYPANYKDLFVYLEETEYAGNLNKELLEYSINILPTDSVVITYIEYSKTKKFVTGEDLDFFKYMNSSNILISRSELLDDVFLN